MEQTTNSTKKEKILNEERLAIRKEADARIDPRTAEKKWKYGYTTDTRLFTDLSNEEKQTGRAYLACAPGSDVWVRCKDLPEAKLVALRGNEQKKKARKATVEIEL